MFEKIIRKFKVGHDIIKKDSFTSIIVQNTTTCPVHCVHCPDKIWNGQTMSDYIWEKLLHDIQLYNINFNNFMFGMSNDPLLDKNLANKILQLSSIFPGRPIGINTSGKHFPKDFLDKIATCVNGISFTFCGYDKKSYEENTRYSSFETVYENIQNVINYPNRKFYIRISYLAIKQNIGHKKDIEKLFPGADIVVTLMSELCGSLKNFEEILPDNRICNGCCPKISDDLAVTFDGKILMCCWDWGHILPVGDLNVHNLKNILEGNTRKQIDKMLIEGRHKEIATCSKCRAGSNDHIKMI